MFNLSSTKRCRLSIGQIRRLFPVHSFDAHSFSSNKFPYPICRIYTPKTLGHLRFFLSAIFLLHSCSHFRPSHLRPNRRICTSGHRTCVLEHSFNVAEQLSYQPRALRSCSVVVTRSGRRSRKVGRESIDVPAER